MESGLKVFERSPGKSLAESDYYYPKLKQFMRMKKKLFRTRGPEAMLLGVCGGLARYLEIDPTVVRIGAALLTVFSFGGLILAYVIMAIIMPQES